VLAATNQPDRIDTAIRRSGRFDKIAYIGLPDQQARTAIFEVHLAGRPCGPAVNCDELARLAKGRVASDIKFLVDEAAREALRAGSDKIRMTHLQSAIQRNRPSVGPSDLVRYEQVHREFEGDRAGTTPKRIGF